MLTIITLFLCATMFVRLFTYKREDGARFRAGMSWLAIVAMASCGASVIFILDGKFHVQPLAWPLVVLLGVLTMATLRCSGNLSAVLKGPESWRGKRWRR